MLGYSKSYQNASEICVFSVESIKIMGSWYVMRWFLTHRYQDLVEPGISIFGVRMKVLLYPEEGGSRFLQVVWVFLPNLME